MSFDPEAWFAAVKTWPRGTEPENQLASPKGVFPAWDDAYDADWDAPRCTECGGLVPRDGCHLCAAHRSDRRWA